MNAFNDKSIAFAAGLAWALLAGVATADDTEIFVGNVASASQAKPNVLFILDDSVSMGAKVITQIGYDPSQPDYASQGCSSSRVYWSTTGALPSCAASNNNYFNMSALKCQRALTAFQTLSGGVYTDNMAQYDTGTQARWEEISAAQKDRVVECQDDRPDLANGWAGHGDGVNTTRVYARNGNTSSRWTSTASSEITWGADPADNTYTLYSGDFLNWAYGPTGEPTRLQVMQEVVNNAINAVNGVNIGLMHFNYEDGGLVSHAVEDVATSSASMQAAVNSLTASNYTPLSETLFEAYRYLTGANVGYGTGSVAASREPTNNARYNTPIDLACQKTHIVYLTDGVPTQDHGATAAIPGLVDTEGESFNTLVGGTCDAETYPADPGNLPPDGGACLDELAEFMHEGDMSSLAGPQNITVHTVGFFIDLPVLEETAQRGGGTYYTADDTASLTTALTSIITTVLDTQATFTAPAVSINSFNQTRHLDTLYFSVFRPSGTAHWPGNLKRYRLRASDATIVDANDQPAIDSATGFFAETSQSFWSAGVDGDDVTLGGAANLIPLPRNVYTDIAGGNLTATGNRVSMANITDTMLGIGGAGDPDRDQVIAFINGVDASDVDNDGNFVEARNQMGDPLHTQPVSVVYGPTSDDARIYLATNDGYLHSIDAETGVERWAFLPEEFLPNQVAFFNDSQAGTGNKYYGVDGSLRVQTLADGDGVVEAANGERVYLFFGMRRGGDAYYGLDVTNPDAPVVMWRLDGNDLPGVGQSWSSARPARINIEGASQNAEKMVIVLGGGYDTTQDSYTASTDTVGNAIYIIDSASGNLLWHGGLSDADQNFAVAGKSMSYSIPADVRVIDLNGDRFADRMYAVDMGGQVWRFDIFNGEPKDSLVHGGVIAQLGAAGLADPTLADTRRFYYAPDAALASFDDVSFWHIGVGSGYREHPNETDNQNRFYALRDYLTFSSMEQAVYDALTPITDDDLVNVTTDLTADVPVSGPDRADGWRLFLDDPSWRGEKVLSETRTLNNEVYVNTFTPGNTGTGCQPALGTNRQYIMSLFNGAPVNNRDGQAGMSRRDRYTESGAGAPGSETVFIFAEDGDGDDEGCEGEICQCTDRVCEDTDDPNLPIRTFWSQESIE